MTEHYRRVHGSTLPEEHDFMEMDLSDWEPNTTRSFSLQSDGISSKRSTSMHRGEALDSIRQNMRTKLVALQAQRHDIDGQISALQEAIAALDKQRR